MTDKLATEFAEIQVEDSSGGGLALGTLWREKTVVLVFVRHYG